MTRCINQSVLVFLAYVFNSEVIVAHSSNNSINVRTAIRYECASLYWKIAENAQCPVRYQEARLSCYAGPYHFSSNAILNHKNMTCEKFIA